MVVTVEGGDMRIVVEEAVGNDRGVEIVADIELMSVLASRYL